MSEIWVYDPSTSEHESKKRDTPFPCFQPTGLRVGSKDEYRFFRSFDLMNGLAPTQKLFFENQADHVHYAAVRGMPVAHGWNPEAFHSKLATIGNRAPVMDWPKHGYSRPRVAASNQFPSTIQVFTNG